MLNKSKISAKIVADSIDNRGNRITTFVLKYPRMIHAELLTHRLFSRNAASSRAIPFKKMVQTIIDDPFIPIAWQKDHKGMQGTEYFTENDLVCPNDPDIKDDVPFHLTQVWLRARDEAINLSTYANGNGLTKQLCNRLLEPFQWYTCLVTSTEFENFYELRCPKYKLFSENMPIWFRSRKDFNEYVKKVGDEPFNLSEEEWWCISESGAEIHIQALAEAMWDAQNESTPKELKAGEWHIPFGDKITATQYYPEYKPNEMTPIKIATARCARLSYMTFDGEINYAKDITLHDTLLASKHMSPFEHCARVMSDEEYYSFFKGEIPISVELGGCICHQDYYPYAGHTEGLSNLLGFEGPNPNNGEFNNHYGWCNNIRGFIQYRYLCEKE